MITFCDLRSTDAIDLALELYFDSDDLTLDEAAALAVAMRPALLDVAVEWDTDAGYVRMPEGDLLAPDGLRA